MGRFVNGAVWVLMLVGVLVGAARLVAIRWWQVPADDPILDASIAPTLRGGDWVLLWRVSPPKFGVLTICPDPSDEASIVIRLHVGEADDQVTFKVATSRINDTASITATQVPAHQITH